MKSSSHGEYVFTSIKIMLKLENFHVQIEENTIGPNLKGITVYYGDFAFGQLGF